MSVNFTLRQNIRNLSEADLMNIRSAYSSMMSINDNRGYSYLAGLHGIPSWYCWHHQKNAHTALNARLFLPWHRAYLYTFEQSLKDRLPTTPLALPWWDWSSDISKTEGIPQAFSVETANNSTNPFYSFHINVSSSKPPLNEDTNRTPGEPSELPSSDTINQLISVGNFNDFSDQLEDIHDQIHGWVGGTMGIIATAAFDPIFWSHHCMIDNIWWLWQQKNGLNNIPSNLLELALAPFELTVKEVLDIHQLGYDYASSQVTVGTQVTS